MWKSYCNFWRHGFDFSSKSSRRPFWYPFIINSIFTLVLVSLGYPWFVNGLRAFKKGIKGSMTPTLIGSTLLIIVIAYGLISMVPRYAIIARRLRDTQFSLDFEWIYLVIKALTYIVFIGSPLFSLMVGDNVVAIWVSVMVSIDAISAVVMLWLMALPTGYHQIAFLARWRKKK